MRPPMLAGGGVPRLLSFLRDSAFRARFFAKGHFAASVKTAAIHTIARPDPVGTPMALRAPRS